MSLESKKNIETASETKSQVFDIESISSTRSGLVSNPFGETTDPYTIKGSSYSSGNTLVNQVSFALSNSIFSYEAVGASDALDAELNSWIHHYHKQNYFGAVPNLFRFQVRSGASNALLGYFKNDANKKNLSVLAGANALGFFYPVLVDETASLPVAFNISAIDFDNDTNSLFSNYLEVLSTARLLNYPVISPVSIDDGLELQQITLLNFFLATISGRPSINLFDGPEMSLSFLKYDRLLSIEKLGDLYSMLLQKYSSSSNSFNLKEAFTFFNKVVGSNYSFFEYSGSSSPETVFVVYGSKQGTEFNNVLSNNKGSNVGLIRVRVPLPFNTYEFLKQIPESTKRIVVVGQINNDDVSTSSSLRADITAALFLSGNYHKYRLEEFTYNSSYTWTPVTTTKVFNEFGFTLSPQGFSTSQNDELPISANSSPTGRYVVWGADNGKLLDLAKKLALSLSLDDSKSISVRTKFDNVAGGGIFQSQIISSLTASAESVDSADIVIVDDVSVLDSFDVLATCAPKGTVILVNNKQVKNSIDEDIISKLPKSFKRCLVQNDNKLIIVDNPVLKEIDNTNDSTKNFSEEFLIQLAFWSYAFPQLDGFIVNKLLQANGGGFELLASVVDKFIQNANEKNAIKDIEIPQDWIKLEDESNKANQEEEKQKQQEKGEDGEEVQEEENNIRFFPTETSFFPNPRNLVDVSEKAYHTGHDQLARKIVFPEAFSTKKVLRPDLPVRNFVVKVQENKRLTPDEYGRNIFHIEFDTTGTGLNYSIGEALGIHGCNSRESVEQFIKFYNLDGDSALEVPNKDDPSLLEIQSVRQTLTSTVDFLGKPPKKFYESLAQFAEDPKEKETLEKLSGPEGAEELKKRQEVEFSTFVDILEEFTSARPPFAELVKIITPLKRREYSIASSQKMHPNSVHLLIVVVDWVDPKGRLRYGHCSKYLSDLAVGDELVVSVKPSIMKLPPLTTQPIIMSGLGTGLAPFKAFIEEKLWQKQQGHEIGEIYLFMGSRHKNEEYLYGELWEAYKEAGILTHIGAAFSRDQPEKIYIQDKIRESIEELTDAVISKNGSFYLCGPTWPVPDITSCLEDIVLNAAKRSGNFIKDVSKVVEDMKEDGRYILEVY